MKQKALYLIVIVCCLSLFSSAKQSGKGCEKACTLMKKVPAEIQRPKPMAADPSPMQFLLYSI